MPIIVDIFLIAGLAVFCWVFIFIWSDIFRFFKKFTQDFKDAIAPHLGICILAFGVGVATILSLLFTQSGLWNDFTIIIQGISSDSDLESSKTDTTNIIEFMKTAVFTLGAVGGAYGLVLAARRSKQGQDQLFNDRLINGIQILKEDELSHRLAGVTILEDLALTSTKTDTIRIILDSFLRTSAPYDPFSDGDSDDAAKHDRHDIFASLDALIRINQKLKSIAKINRVDLAHLSTPSKQSEIFSIYANNCNFNHAHLMQRHVLNSIFMHSTFIHTRFYHSMCVNVHFYDSNLVRVLFWRTNFKNCNFKDVDCTGAYFSHATGLTEDNFTDIFYEDGNPPKGLPDELKSALIAYKWRKDKNGKKYRQIVNTDGRFDEEDIVLLENNLNDIPR